MATIIQKDEGVTVNFNIPCIYKITNKLDNKSYVGSTKDVGARWNNHIRDLIKNNHHSRELQSDWNKYGFTGFTFEILDINTKDLMIAEQYFIDFFNSIENGYNSVNAIKANRVNKYEDMSTIPIEHIENIKKNMVLHGKKKGRTKSPKINSSYSFKWYKGCSVNIVEKELINVYYGKFRTKHLDDNCAWVVPDCYKGEISVKGNVNCFSSEFNTLDRKSKFLIYLMNPYPSVNLEVKPSDFALFNVIKWIIANADINKEFHIYCGSERVEYLLGEFIGLWGNERDWSQHHKINTTN